VMQTKKTAVVGVLPPTTSENLPEQKNL